MAAFPVTNRMRQPCDRWPLAVCVPGWAYLLCMTTFAKKKYDLERKLTLPVLSMDAAPIALPASSQSGPGVTAVLVASSTTAAEELSTHEGLIEARGQCDGTLSRSAS